MSSLARRTIRFYVGGFRRMTVGRALWAIVLVKLAVLALLAHTLFPDLLETRFADDAARADHVLGRLSEPRTHPREEKTP